MSLIKFLDSTSNKRKSLIFPAGEDDIIINLPKDSGILTTDRLAEKKIRENDSGYDRNVIFILKPDIKENNGGVTTTDWDGYFKIAGFRVADGYLGKHTGTEWIAYSDERLTTLVDKSSDDLNKEMWKPNANIPNLKLYVRYRFVSNSIYSPWSDSIVTITSSGGISPFDVSVEENTLTPGCLISGFKTYGDAIGVTHTATTWIVYESTNGKLGNKVFDSGKDSTNKISFTIPNGVLKGDLEYSLQVTLHTDNAKYANSIPYIRKFTTIGAYIHRPVLQYKPTKDNQHKIIASEYVSTARNETLVNAVWSLYDADDDRLINTVTNTSSEYDITPFISNNKKYYVTLVYKSNTLTSKEGKCVFNVSGSKAEPIVATFTTSDKKLPILNLSKFYVPGQTDEIKSFAFRIERDMPIHKRKYNRRENWFNGKYNEPMTHTFEVADFSAFASPGEVWTNEPIKLKGYIIGNKYNSDMFEATFTPSINLNYKVEHIGDDWSNLKFKVSLDNTLDPVNFTPDWVGIIVVQCYKPEGTVPVDGYKEYGTSNYLINASSYGYEYNKDYTFTIKIYTSIGAKFIDYTLKMERGIISDPTMEITAVHGYGNYVNMKVKSSEYKYSKTIDNTNGLKEIKLTIQDTTDSNKVVYEKIQTVDDKGPAVYNFDINYDKDHLDKSLKHNTKYLVSIEYKNNRDERSKRVSKEFTTIERDAVTWPDVKLCIAYSSRIKKGPTKNIPFIEYVYFNTNFALYAAFINYNFDKMIYRIKKENGEIVDETIVTLEIHNNMPSRGIYVYNKYKRLTKNGKLEYDYQSYIPNDPTNENEADYQNELFKYGETYIAELEFCKEDLSKITSDVFIIYYEFGVTNDIILKARYLDNLKLRREFSYHLPITDPGLPSGYTLAANEVNDIVINNSGISTPNISLKNITTMFGTTFTSNSILIDTNIKSENLDGTIKVVAFDNPYTDPTFKEGDNTLPNKVLANSTILTYDDVKPLFYVNFIDGKWYLVIQYTLFPREIERNKDLIYPFVYTFSTFNFNVVFTYQYKNNEKEFKRSSNINNTGNLTIWMWNMRPETIGRIKGVKENYISALITTDKFIEGKIGLSKVRSDKYDNFCYPTVGGDLNYNTFYTGKKTKYTTPYLEYIPINGCKLLLAIYTSDLVTNKLNDADNLLIQPNPKNGVHYKFYKVNADGTEEYVNGIEDAFSVGVPTSTSENATGRYDELGTWTKSVNMRNVLEHGQLYKLKMWFVPYNNETMGRSCYFEKYFIGYDINKGDVIGPVNQLQILSGKPTRYNRLMDKYISDNQPFAKIAGESYGISIIDSDQSRPAEDTINEDSDPTTLTEVLMFDCYRSINKRYIPIIFAYTDLTDIRYVNKTTIGNILRGDIRNAWAHKSTPLTISNIWTDSSGKEHYYSKPFKDIPKLDLELSNNFFIKNPTNIDIQYPKYTNANSILIGEMGGNYIYKYREDMQFTYEFVTNYSIDSMPLLDKTCNANLNLHTEYFMPSQTNINRPKYPYQGNLVPIYVSEVNDVVSGKKTTDIACMVYRMPDWRTLYRNGGLLPNNMRTHSDFTIGEQHITAIGKGNMQLDKPGNNTDNQINFKVTKNVPDWIKDTVEDGLPLIQDEHIKFTDIKNLPQEDIDKSKANFPLNPNEDKYVYKTLHIYKFSELADLNIYGSDMMNMVSPLLRNLEGINYSDVGLTKPGMITSTLKKDSLTTIAAFYRYGVENSKWVPAEVGFTNNNYMWPLYKKVENGKTIYDITLPTQGNPLRSIYRDIKFKSYVGNTVGTIETSSFYSALTYDMIAIVFKYNRFRLYNIIYYRVDRTTGEMTYHAEDQNIVFNQETSFGSGLDLPLMSNKAMCFLHTVKPNGDIVRHPEVPAKGGGEPSELLTYLRKNMYVVKDRISEDLDGGNFKIKESLFIIPEKDDWEARIQNIIFTSDATITPESASVPDPILHITYISQYEISYKYEDLLYSTKCEFDLPMTIVITDTDDKEWKFNLDVGNFIKYDQVYGRTYNIYEAIVNAVD